MATIGSGVVYSFPSIIVPKNIVPEALPLDSGFLRKQGYSLTPQDLQLANWVDFYEQQLIKSQEWFRANTWMHSEEDVKLYFAEVMKE